MAQLEVGENFEWRPTKFCIFSQFYTKDHSVYYK